MRVGEWMARRRTDAPQVDTGESETAVHIGPAAVRRSRSELAHIAVEDPRCERDIGADGGVDTTRQEHRAGDLSSARELNQTVADGAVAVDACRAEGDVDEVGADEDHFGKVGARRHIVERDFAQRVRRTGGASAQIAAVSNEPYKLIRYRIAVRVLHGKSGAP